LVTLGVGAAIAVVVDRGGVPPLLDTSGCTAEVDGHIVEVDLEQAQNAALIAAMRAAFSACSRSISTVWPSTSAVHPDVSRMDGTPPRSARTSVVATAPTATTAPMVTVRNDGMAGPG